jgi:hypothetical protein
MRRTVTTLVLLLAVSAPAFAGPYPDAGAPGWTRSEVRRYYPAPPPPPRYVHPILGWVELRGGFYDSQDVSKNDWTIGMKTSAHIAPNVLVGFSADYQRRDDAGRQVTSQYVDPTGHVVTTTTTTAQNESNLWPLMGTLEFHLPMGGLDPYFGGGAGWEFLNVQAYDYNRGYAYSADYDGFGYQFFGGVRLPIGPRAKFSGEAYWNGANVDRNFYDPYSGLYIDESIDVDGFGGRAGLSFAY